MPITLKQLQECWWVAGRQALNKRCVWRGASLSDPHLISDHMIMTHLSPTLDAAVIPNSSLPGERKLLLLSAKRCNCFPIRKDKVSLWPPCEHPPPPHQVAPLRIFSLLSPPLQSRGSYQTKQPWGRWTRLAPALLKKMCEIGVWVLSVLSRLGVYCAGGWAPYWHPWSLPLTSQLRSAPCFSFTKLPPSSRSPAAFTCSSPTFTSHFTAGDWRRLTRSKLASVVNHSGFSTTWTFNANCKSSYSLF